MRMKRTWGCVVLVFCCCAVAQTDSKPDDAAKARDLMRQAQIAAENDRHEEALKLATEAVKAAPGLASAHMMRGIIHDRMGKYAEAESDQTQAMKLEPKSVNAFQRRGEARFKQGKINESISDFDKVIELVPDQEPHHWQRGICYYYAGRYKDGVRQFDIHQTVNSADVENAVWRFICQAKIDGFDKARRDILKIGKDRRVPMRQVYDLFAGKAQPQDVLDAAKAGDPNPAQLKNQLFYAHQYLGLYYEALGQTELARKHMRSAAEEFNMGHYMWQVAKVHWQRMKKEESKEKEKK